MNNREWNFTKAKHKRRMEEIEGSIQRYLVDLGTADRQEDDESDGGNKPDSGNTGWGKPVFFFAHLFVNTHLDRIILLGDLMVHARQFIYGLGQKRALSLYLTTSLGRLLQIWNSHI